MTDRITRNLAVPEPLRSSTEAYFSRRSGLIVLEGPRGWLLARYQHVEAPDPYRHVFFTEFPEDYPVFDGARVPAEAPADVEAIAWPVQRSVDPRVTIASGAVSEVEADTSSTARDIILSAGYDNEAAVGVARQTGVRIGPSSFQVQGEWGD